MGDVVVGVVIPARNCAHFLSAALESVMGQEHRPLDVVVVDDGSDDDTLAVAQSWGPPVRGVRQEHAGIGAARNRGVALVQGELLTFLDADDLWPERRLERAVAVLDAHPGVELVFGLVRSFRQTVDGTPVGVDRARPAHLVTGMLARRAAFERVGGFRTGLRVAETLDWLLRARELGLREEMLDEQVLWRRVHGANNSLRHRDARVEYARALKASLDRRRAS